MAWPLLSSVRESSSNDRERQAIEPGLERQSLRLLLTSPQGGGDGFVNDFFFGDAIGGNRFLRLAEIDFALDKALEARQVDVHVGANVVRGNGWRENGGERLLEWNFAH